MPPENFFDVAQFLFRKAGLMRPGIRKTIEFIQKRSFPGNNGNVGPVGFELRIHLIANPQQNVNHGREQRSPQGNRQGNKQQLFSSMDKASTHHAPKHRILISLAEAFCMAFQFLTADQQMVPDNFKN